MRKTQYRYCVMKSIVWGADHLFGRLALGGAGRFREGGLHVEPATIFHEHVAHEAELGLLAASLAIKLRLGISARGMRCKVERIS